jgi:putative phosphoesterase
MADTDEVRVGVISDTHGLLRSAVYGAFEGVDRILHAGDVGEPAILTELEVLAPVDAVWGNVDGPEVRAVTEEFVEGEASGLAFALVHGHQVRDYAELPGRFPGADLIVHGHSHVPSLDRERDTLVLNPGSAGPRRTGKPVSVALLTVRGGEPSVRHLELGG